MVIVGVNNYDNKKRRYVLCGFKSCSRFRTRWYSPCFNIQNDLGNKYSPTVIAAAITSQTNKTKLPTHIEIQGDSETLGLKNNSVILAEQIRTIDKSRLKEKIGHIDDERVMNKINNALGVSFGLEE